LIPIGPELIPLRRDYEKKDLEIANMKAPRGNLRFPLEPFSSLCLKSRKYFQWLKNYRKKGGVHE